MCEPHTSFYVGLQGIILTGCMKLIWDELSIYLLDGTGPCTHGKKVQ